MKALMLGGGALIALVAIPALAQDAAAPRAPEGPLTRAAVEQRLETRFARLDTDRDGFVTKAEASARREAARERRTEKRGDRRAAMFDRMDADKDGSISRAEFDAVPAPGPRAHRRAHAADGKMHRRAAGALIGGRIFEAADGDNDGRVSRAEARAAALAHFDRVDANRDGAISAEERRSARAAMRERFRERRGG